MIKRLTSIVLMLSTIAVVAQRNTASPYSSFGIGENYTPKTVLQSSMGGIGVAMQQYNHLNFANPAAVAKLRVATYALGGQTTFLTLKDDGSSQSGNTTEFSYIALGFPIGKKAGFSLGLQPMSSVGYSFIDEKLNGEVVEQLGRFKGSGGTNRLYGNFGITLYEGLSAGIEGAFIFGGIDNSITDTQSGVALSTKYNRESTIRGGQMKLGLQYKTNLSKTVTLNTGIAMKFKSELTQSGTEQLYSFAYTSKRVESPRDTLYNRNFKRNIKSPFAITGGVGIGKTNKWYVAINSEYQGAKQNIDNISNLKYENALRTSIGGHYIPRINSISSYWNRITYRGGFRFERTGMMVNGSGNGTNFTSINDFGINIGLGLPLPKQISSLNLGVEYGQRGTTNNNLIKENYFNVRLGLSLNSINWFRKREID